MKWLALLLLLAGCQTPVADVAQGARMVIIARHLDDTPAEYLAWLDRRIEQNKRWCYKGKELSACRRQMVYVEEKNNFLKTGVMSIPM